MLLTVIFNPKTEEYMDADGNWIDSIANACEFLSTEQAQRYLKHIGIEEPDDWVITYEGKPRER